MVKTAGMFVELTQARHPAPAQSIADHISERPLEDVKEVLTYLNRGYVLIGIMDVENDVLDAERQLLNGSSILTDGDWLWRKDFPYYVRYHNVVVPDDLLAMIRDRNYTIPSVPDHVLANLSKQARPLAFGRE
jgi:hypothetical protein